MSEEIKKSVDIYQLKKVRDYVDSQVDKHIIIKALDYQTIDSYEVPNLTVEQVQEAFTAFSEGKEVLIEDQFGFITMPVLESSTIDGTAIKVFFNGIIVLNYKINGSSVVTTGIRIGGQEVFVFKGYVSPSEPENPKEGELWHLGTAMPTSFPVNVKRYFDGGWSALVEQYTPNDFDVWADTDDNHRYYWFIGAWNKIAVEIDPDDVTINKSNTGKLQIKDGGINSSKISNDLKATSISANPSDNKFVTESALANYIVSGNNGYAKLLSEIDLNTITSTGLYACNVCTNRPTDSNGTMIVMKFTESYATQVYFEFISNEVYVRQFNNSIWTNWKKIS